MRRQSCDSVLKWPKKDETRSGTGLVFRIRAGDPKEETAFHMKGGEKRKLDNNHGGLVKKKDADVQFLYRQTETITIAYLVRIGQSDRCQRIPRMPVGTRGGYIVGNPSRISCRTLRIAQDVQRRGSSPKKCRVLETAGYSYHISRARLRFFQPTLAPQK